MSGFTFVHHPDQRILGKVVDIHADPYGINVIVDKIAKENNNMENWSYVKDAPSFEYQFAELFGTVIAFQTSKRDEILQRLILLKRSVKSVCDDYDKFRKVFWDGDEDGHRNCYIPKRIWWNKGSDGKYHTTVEWTDGERTSVGVEAENEESVDAYAGMCCALAKRLYGSSSEAQRKYVNALEEVGRPKREKEAQKQRIKEAKLHEQNEKRLAHEARVQEEIERLRVLNEAGSRYASELSAKETRMSEEG